MVHALRSRRVVTPEGVRDVVVVIENERIAAIVAPDAVAAGVPVEDLGEIALLPGLVDVHTHINAPGRAEWEGFATGTRAAAAGGFTTIVDMPLNCLPETTNVAALELKREAAHGKCAVDFALWGGAVDGNQEELEPLAKAGVPGFKCFLIYPGCEGFGLIGREELERALPHVAKTGLPLLVHAELAGPIETATQELNASGADWREYATYLASRPDEAELEAIAMLVQLCREHRFRLHIVHLSTAKALPMLAAAKAEGLPISVETCPHYLHLTAEAVPAGATQFKCAPPVRSAENCEALWQGLLEGTIDLIATDHSPCPPAMKRMEEGRFDWAWGGIASLSTALPVVWTECVRRGIGLERLAQWMCAHPARLASVDDRVGAIGAGRYANLVAFDPDATAEVVPKRLFYRHPVSPYLGERLHGVVQRTWLRGRPVFEHGRFAEPARGRELGIATAEVLRSWNRLSAEEAFALILPCNGSKAWAQAMVHARPVFSAEQLYARADEIWRMLEVQEWREAFDSHPRIGERHAKAATAESLQWSAGEQSAAWMDEAIQRSLAQENEVYEQRFGHIFIVCASGKSAREMLNLLERRLMNDPQTELLEAAEQQRRITQLRLRKWLGTPLPRCEDV